jgi:hypothetical protein
LEIPIVQDEDGIIGHQFLSKKLSKNRGALK